MNWCTSSCDMRISARFGCRAWPDKASPNGYEAPVSLCSGLPPLPAWPWLRSLPFLASRCSHRRHFRVDLPATNPSPEPKRWHLPSPHAPRSLSWYPPLQPRRRVEAAPRSRARKPSPLARPKDPGRSIPTHRCRRALPSRPRKPAARNLLKADRPRPRPLLQRRRRLPPPLPPKPLHRRPTSPPHKGTLRLRRQIPAPGSRRPARTRVTTASGGSKPRRAMATRRPRLIPLPIHRRRPPRPRHLPPCRARPTSPGTTTATTRATASNRCRRAEAGRRLAPWPPR
jgi:hypothetical protein